MNLSVLVSCETYTTVEPRKRDHFGTAAFVVLFSEVV